MKLQPLNTSKMHIALDQALRDLGHIETNQRYVIDMDDWHCPSSNQEQCYVCLAGAVIARRMGAPMSAYRTPGAYQESVGNMLYAINNLRQGRIRLAVISLSNINISTEVEQAEAEILEAKIGTVSYKKDRDVFFAHMRKLVHILRTYNL